MYYEYPDGALAMLKKLCVEEWTLLALNDPTQSHGISCYSHEINLLIRVHQHDFAIFFVSQNDFKSNVNNNKLEGKTDKKKYRFKYSDTERF